MRRLLSGALLIVLTLGAFYLAVRICIWAYIQFGEFVYGVITASLFWALVLAATRSGRA